MLRNPSHRIVTPYTLRVDEGLCGAAAGQLVTIWQLGGVVGQDSFDVQTPHKFTRVGERVLLYGFPYGQAVLPNVWEASFVGQLDEQGNVRSFGPFVTAQAAVRAAIASVAGPDS